MKILQIFTILMLSFIALTEQIFSSNASTSLKSSQSQKKADMKKGKVQTEKEIWKKLKESKKDRKRIEGQLNYMMKQAKRKEDKEKLEKTLKKVEDLDTSSASQEAPASKGATLKR